MNVQKIIGMKIVFSLLLLVSAVGCRTLHSDPESVMTVVNNGTASIRNVEITYPGGYFGAPSIPAGGSLQRSVPAKGACHLKVKFLDATNIEQPTKDIALQGNCPKSLTIEVAGDYSVTARETK